MPPKRFRWATPLRKVPGRGKAHIGAQAEDRTRNGCIQVDGGVPVRVFLLQSHVYEQEASDGMTFFFLDMDEINRFSGGLNRTSQQSIQFHPITSPLSTWMDKPRRWRRRPVPALVGASHQQPTHAAILRSLSLMTRFYIYFLITFNYGRQTPTNSLPR